MSRQALLVTALFVIAFGLAESAQAQVPTGSYPAPQYYAFFADYYDGEYKRSFKDYGTTPGAFRQGSTRFLDSACYWTIAGECQFHTGNFDGAIELYEQSLALYLEHQSASWQQRVQQPIVVNNALPNAVQRTNITWGQPKRSFEIPRLPETVGVLFGDLNAAQTVLTQGGVFDPARVKPVDVGEIMRCMAIALHRRRYIKGPVCKFEPLTSNLVNQLESVQKNDGSLLGAWNGVLSGMAYANQGEFDLAKRNLEQGLQFGGRYDHQLTPLALLELAIINHQLRDTNTAAFQALEASYSAAIFGQYDVLEEALALGATIHLETQQTGPYAPLANAIVWCKRNNARLAQISLAVRLAECYSEGGDSASSAKLLSDAVKTFSSRTGFGAGNLNGRANYLAAVNLFLDGNFDDGRVQLQKAIAEYAPTSRWLYQLALTENYVLRNVINSRHAQTLYSLMLRDPSEREWRHDPIEAMTFLASPHLPSIDRWLQLAIADRNYKQAVQIAELWRRHRFYSELPLGGRDLAFRWTMHAPREAVTNVAERQRVDFNTRYPKYKEISDRAEEMRLKFLAQPLQHTPKSDEEKAYLKSFDELIRATQLQDSLLASIALRREPAEMAFPPQIDVDEMKLQLKPNQSALYIVETGNQYFFFELTSLGVRLLSQHTSKDIVTKINRLIRDTGLEERQLSLENLADEKWKVGAAELAKALLGELNLKGDEGQPHELIIVPSGATWYLPFEALCFRKDDGSSEFLFQKTRIRYSPTLGLAIIPQRPIPKIQRSAFFLGEICDQVDAKITSDTLDPLQKANPTITAFSDKLEIPSAYFGSVCDEFVVWIGMGKMPSGGPWALDLVQKDRGTAGSDLASWLKLPWAGPTHVVLPFFESAGARGVPTKNAGEDLFLTTMGMLAAGTKSIMISRWSTNGKSGLEFAKTYWEKSRSASPMDALSAAEQAMLEMPVDFDRESKIKKTKEPPVTKSTNPLFWAGYFVVDVPSTADPNAGIEKLQDSAAPPPDGANAAVPPAATPAPPEQPKMVVPDPPAEEQLEEKGKTNKSKKSKSKDKKDKDKKSNEKPKEGGTP
ncbi:MAG: CHAT domain-containing protein [Pirellulaceae bacterium]